MSELLLRAFLAMIVLEGCSGEGAPDLVVPTDEPTVEEPPIAGPSVNVRDFGATPDDQTDDTRAFEAAIAALPLTGGTVVVPAGVFLLRAIDASPNRAIDLSEKHGITLRGAGEESTRLRMAPATYQGDTHMILIRDASGMTLEGLTLDGNRSEVVYRDEQSHGIQIVSSTDTRIRRMTFQNMGGDGVRLFGAPQAGEAWTERVWIEDCSFHDTTRNGISIQRAARFVEIRGNTFERISDQSISAEPSGTGAPTDILVEDNLVRHSSGAWAIALSGIRPADVLQRLTFRNNTIEDGAAYFLWTNDLVVESNVIHGDRIHSPLRIHGVSKALVTGNEVSGQAEGGTGIVQVVNHDNVLPSEVTLSRNTILATTGLSGIHVRDAGGEIAIVENTIVGDEGNHGILFNNILVKGTTRVQFRVVENEVRNFRTTMRFVTRGDAFQDVEILGNVLDHDQSPASETIGILFDGTGPFEAFASLLSNSFGKGITSQVVVRN